MRGTSEAERRAELGRSLSGLDDSDLLHKVTLRLDAGNRRNRALFIRLLSVEVHGF